jgi:RNA polymerase sigma-70 factor, ECF subfamily
MAIRIDEVDLQRDRDLVQRYQAGDPGAFDDLYRRYFDRLHGYCARRVGDRHTAEELAQEAFVRALRAMPRFAGERRFYPWMTVIAQRLCIDHHRRHGRVEVSDQVDPGAVEPDHDLLFRQVDSANLAVALERLAPRHREVLDLREREALSYAEIAERLEVPVSTVEALLHRARKALRREYLAVAGRDRFWGLPLLGVLAARLDRWRLRDLDRAPEAVAWATPAVAAAVTAAVLAVPGGPAQDTESLRATERPAPVAATSVAPTPPPDDAVTVTVPEPAPVTIATAPAPSPEPDPRPLPPADVAAGPARVYTDPEKVEEVAEHTESMPMHGATGEVFYGLDPAAPVRNLVDTTTGTLRTLLGGTR